jgi:hypothetical protein
MVLDIEVNVFYLRINGFKRALLIFFFGIHFRGYSIYITLIVIRSGSAIVEGVLSLPDQD